MGEVFDGAPVWLLTTRPYTSKRHSLLFPTYVILFEDTPVREVVGYTNAKELTFLLNTAWQLGAGTGYIQGQQSQT